MSETAVSKFRRLFDETQRWDKPSFDISAFKPVSVDERQAHKAKSDQFWDDLFANSADPEAEATKRYGFIREQVMAQCPSDLARLEAAWAAGNSEGQPTV